MKSRNLLTLFAGLAFALPVLATDVSLKITGAAGAASNTDTTVTLSPGNPATLTVDIQIDIDSRGLGAAFLGFRWDQDLTDEVDLISYEEIAWSKKSSSGIVKRTLIPALGGVQSSQESQGASADGYLFAFDGTSVSSSIAPRNTTLTFARIVFKANADPVADGFDIFLSGALACQIETEACDGSKGTSNQLSMPALGIAINP